MLPYKVKGVYARTDIKNLSICEFTTHLYGEMEESFNGKEKYEFIPYLRSMSSMTEEEESEWRLTFDTVYDLVPGGDLDNEDDYDDNWHNEPSAESFDWLNAHHFDYRGLIEKGLAIEVTEENNPYV